MLEVDLPDVTKAAEHLVKGHTRHRGKSCPERGARMSHSCYRCGDPAYFRTSKVPRDEPGTSAWACPRHKREFVRAERSHRTFRVLS